MKGKIIFSFSPPKQFEGDPEIRKWYNECAQRVAAYRNKKRKEDDEWIAKSPPQMREDSR